MGRQDHAPTALPPGTRPNTPFTAGWVGPKAGLKIQKHDPCINGGRDRLLSAICLDVVIRSFRSMFDTTFKVICYCLRSRRLVITKVFKFLWSLIGYFLLVDDNKNSNRPFTQHNLYCTKIESLHALHAANVTKPFYSTVVLVRSAGLSAGHTERSDMVRCWAGNLQTVVLCKKRAS